MSWKQIDKSGLEEKHIANMPGFRMSFTCIWIKTEKKIASLTQDHPIARGAVFPLDTHRINVG